MEAKEGNIGNAVNFHFSVVPAAGKLPTAGKPLLEGSGTLGDVTIIMGRPRTGKSLFLRYLFALLTEDYELAMRTSEQILDNGGWVKLRVGDIQLSCSKSDDGKVGCDITPHPREEAYLFYEGVLFTLKHRLISPESAEVANAMARLLERVARYREGRWRYDISYSDSDKKLYERVDGRLIDSAFASAAVVTAGVLERVFLLNAWLLLDGAMDVLFPEEVFYLAGRASSARARLVVVTHSPWVLDVFRCGRAAADVKAYEFAEGKIKEIGLSTKTYGDVFEKLYVLCG
ncbi:MAG: hypothetical protein ACO2PM_07095 [Pyrobaculum sp.]|jgi:hypothetical protein